jgi:hypothetical protein
MSMMLSSLSFNDVTGKHDVLFPLSTITTKCYVIPPFNYDVTASSFFHLNDDDDVRGDQDPTESASPPASCWVRRTPRSCRSPLASPPGPRRTSGAPSGRASVQRTGATSSSLVSEDTMFTSKSIEYKVSARTRRWRHFNTSPKSVSGPNMLG